MGRLRWGFTRRDQMRDEREGQRAYPHRVRLVHPLPGDDDLTKHVRKLDGTVIIELQIRDGDEDYEERRIYVLHCNHITTAMELKLRWG